MNKERLNYIFDAVYDELPANATTILRGEDKMASLLCTLKAMQALNHWFRWNDTRELFSEFNQIFNFERNSEGTTMWLGMILAINELYGFSNIKLLEVMKTVTVSK